MTPPIMPVEPANIYGINFAGGEFGDIFDANGNRTVYGGGRYYYPSKPHTPEVAHDQMDYFWLKGVRIMRLPIKWERVQRTLFGELYYGPDVPFTATNDLDMRRILEVIDYWTNVLGGVVLLDVHNYMGYTSGTYIDELTGARKNLSSKIKYDSATGMTVEALSDLWVRLANVFASNTKVWFGIMNEPSGDGATPSRTSTNMQAVVNAIRSLTPALNRITIAPSSYSNALRYVDNGNAAYFATNYDPVKNMVVELHNCIDTDQSGTKGVCVVQTLTSNQLVAATLAARAGGYRLGLGEFAGGKPDVAGQEQCAMSVPAIYQYMKNNADVWAFFTTWSAGFPSSYIFTLEPSGSYATGIASPGMQMLQPYL